MKNEGEKGRPAGIPIRKKDVQPAFGEMERTCVLPESQNNQVIESRTANADSLIQ